MSMSEPLLENPPVHTLRSRLQDLAHYALYYGLRYAPIDAVSAIGSAFVRWSVPRNRPWILEGARNNLKRLWPDADDAKINAAVLRFLDNVGRLMAEFAVLTRLHDAGRIKVTERFERHVPDLPNAATVAVALHTGNWETSIAALHARGHKVTGFAIPPETWAQRVIATRVRKHLGLTTLLPDARGLRSARRILKEGGVVYVFCDEARAGRTMGPFFGRPPHLEGNLAIAAWLARDSGARLAVVHCRRVEKANFLIDAVPYFHLPERTAPVERKSTDDVAYLNAIIEPIVLANLDQWYFLDNTLDR